MTDQLSNALAICGLAVVVLILWALSIAYIRRDLERRSMPGYERVFWLLLVILLPAAGGLAYLFGKGLDRFLSPRAPGNPVIKKRVTAEKPPDSPGVRLPTIAGADLYRQTAVEVPPPATPPRTREGRGSLFLQFLSGPLAGRKFPIYTLPARIGRGPLAAIRLDDDPGVSRQHAEIYESAGRTRIRDLKSTHGTYLNGKNISDEILNPGDHLSIGLSSLVFMVEEQGGKP